MPFASAFDIKFDADLFLAHAFAGIIEPPSEEPEEDLRPAEVDDLLALMWADADFWADFEEPEPEIEPDWATIDAEIAEHRARRYYERVA